MEVFIEKIKEYKIIVICVSLGLILGGFFLLKPVAQTPAKESNLQTEFTTVSKDSTDEKEDGNQKEEVVEQDLITVDVKGAVKSPGIYDLPVGSRINDAVQKAGGRCSVTILGTPGAVVSKLVFIPKSEKMYLTTESPCFEPSIRPSNLTTASESSANAMISYQ